MSKTQINIQIPVVEGYENETISQFRNILSSYKDIEFGLSILPENSITKFNLVYLSKEHINIPIVVFKIGLNKIEKKTNSNLEKILSKLAYVLRNDKFSKLIGTDNRQFFIPNNEGDLINTEFLNNGSKTDDQINDSIKEIEEVFLDIVKNTNNYSSSLYEDIKKDDTNISLEMKQENETYRLLHENKPKTEWKKYNKNEEWDSFIKGLYKEYKSNIRENESK